MIDSRSNLVPMSNQGSDRKDWFSIFGIKDWTDWSWVWWNQLANFQFLGLRTGPTGPGFGGTD